MPSAQVKIQITETKQLDELLAKHELLLRGKALQKALRAGGNVVAKRARQLCPRSIQTGTRAAWSKSTRAARAGVKPLAETIGVVVRDYGPRFVMLVGPQYPAGALGHLVEYGHAEVLYGVPTGRRVPPHPFMRPAVDETIGQVHTAIVSSLQGDLA